MFLISWQWLVGPWLARSPGTPESIAASFLLILIHQALQFILQFLRDQRAQPPRSSHCLFHQLCQLSGADSR